MVDYFTDDQVAELLVRLQELTASDALKWAPLTEEQRYAFFARTASYAFVIRSRDQDDYAPHVLTIASAEDEPKTLQEIETVDWDKDTGKALEALYDTVKRKTFDMHTVANKLFEELDGLAVRQPRSGA